MSQLIVAAVVSPYRIHFALPVQGEANIVVSVTDTNGVPVTGLVQADFHVMMSPELTPAPARINTFVEYQATFPTESLPGVYEIGVVHGDQAASWVRVPYTFAVAVTQTTSAGQTNQGQTVVLMDLSDLLPMYSEAH
jgi:hypothetical protein